MPDDELRSEQPLDELQELLEQCGAATSPRFLRLRRVAVSMQSLEWQLVRKGKSADRSKPDEDL